MIQKIKINNKILRIKDCKGLSSVRGLMFDSMNDKDGALIYANSVWMPFVKQTLNLVFLDKDMKVVENDIAAPLTLNPKTWRTYSNDKARYCLELKNTDLKIRTGMKIRMKHL
jgi:uncharacterized membrane protein (UPF0127 family)